MTDIGRLKELEAKASVPSSNRTLMPFTREAFEYTVALHDAAPHLLAEIETLRAENERLKVALRDIAAFNDGLANDRLASTGSYAAFDEPWSVEIARNALAAYDQGKVT